MGRQRSNISCEDGLRTKRVSTRGFLVQCLEYIKLIVPTAH